MKLEHERGVTADTRQINGRLTFEMAVEDSLVLTGGTKVFKAAAFAPAADADPLAEPTAFVCEGRLSDTQNPFTAAGIAAYFADEFLGVKLKAEPRVLTEQVFSATEEFIN